MKEGPGVSKDAAKKKGFFLYWDIVFRKFTKFMGLNAIYMLTSILYLVIAYVFLSSMVISAFGMNESIELIAKMNATDADTAAKITSTLYFSIRTTITLLLFNFLGSGPVSAAYAYVSRCYTLGQHAWLFSDGWDKIKENFLYSMIVVVIDILVIFIGMNAISFYGALANNTAGAMSLVFSMVRAFVMVLLFVYAMAHTYIYQIMVTYECKFGMIWKSALIMTIAKLPINFLLTAVTAVAIVLLCTFFGNPLIGAVIYWIVGMTFMKYPLDFYATRVIEKNMKAVKKQQKKREAKITYLDGNNEE